MDVFDLSGSEALFCTWHNEDGSCRRELQLTNKQPYTPRSMVSRAHLALSQNDFFVMWKDHLGGHFLHPSDMAQGHGLVDLTVSFWAYGHFEDMIILRIWSLCEPCRFPQPW